MNVRKGFKIAMAQADKNASQVAREIGVSRSAISRVMTRNSVSIEFTAKVASSCHIRTLELLRLMEV